MSKQDNLEQELIKKVDRLCYAISEYRNSAIDREHLYWDSYTRDGKKYYKGKISTNPDYLMDTKVNFKYLKQLATQADTKNLTESITIICDLLHNQKKEIDRDLRCQAKQKKPKKPEWHVTDYLPTLIGLCFGVIPGIFILPYNYYFIKKTISYEKKKKKWKQQLKKDLAWSQEWIECLDYHINSINDTITKLKAANLRTYVGREQKQLNTNSRNTLIYPTIQYTRAKKASLTKSQGQTKDYIPSRRERYSSPSSFVDCVAPSNILKDAPLW